MLKIKDFIFQEDWGDRRSCLMFFKADQEESASWAVDIGFKPGDFEGNEISPSICINPIDTDKSTVKELVGTTFSVKTVEESEEREDSFYIYENEPLMEYRIEVLDIVEAKAHIKCNGGAYSGRLCGAMDRGRFRNRQLGSGNKIRAGLG